MPRQRVWNVLAASIRASDRFMRLNTGRLGPASAASSGSAKRFRGRVELLDRTRAGLLGVERILDTADEEARLVDPSAQDALRRRAQLVADGLQHVLYRRQDVLLAVAEARQVVALDLVEVGEDDVQLAGVAGDRDALEGGDRGRLHRLGGVVGQQHRGDATSAAPRDAAPEHNVAAGRRAGLARQRLKRLRPTNRVRPVQGVCARGRAPVHAPQTRSPLRSSTGGGGVAPPGQLTGEGTHTRKGSTPGGGLLRMAVGWRPPPDELMCPKTAGGRDVDAVRGRLTRRTGPA